MKGVIISEVFVSYMYSNCNTSSVNYLSHHAGALQVDTWSTLSPDTHNQHTPYGIVFDEPGLCCPAEWRDKS